MEKQNRNENNQQKGEKLGRKILEEGPKFNYFWVYAIILVFIIISFNLSFFSETAKESNINDLKTMLLNDDVDHVSVVNDRQAEVYLKENALNKDEYVKKGVNKTR